MSIRDYFKKIAVVKLSNYASGRKRSSGFTQERANWVQEICLLIQDTVLRAASLYFQIAFENASLMTMRVHLTVPVKN